MQGERGREGGRQRFVWGEGEEGEEGGGLSLPPSAAAAAAFEGLAALAALSVRCYTSSVRPHTLVA